MVRKIHCPLCDNKSAHIYARDNPFIIFKCDNCGFVYYDKLSGKCFKGTIVSEKPFGSLCMEGVIAVEGENFRFTDTYYRTPKDPDGTNFYAVLLGILEESLKELRETARKRKPEATK